MKITRWTNGTTLYDDDADTINETVVAAVKTRADLTNAHLTGADLTGAEIPTPRNPEVPVDSHYEAL